jgi:hypothetical protein
MDEIVRQHLSDKGVVNISGISLYHNQKDHLFEPFHFIDMTSPDDSDLYKKLRPKWIVSAEFARA